jgi:MoaA/NifB/PqqE/SkfB family radical SAM enzyme
VTHPADHPDFCVLPWVGLTMNPDGTVLPCCVNWDLTLGNLQESTIQAVWEGFPYQALRRTFLAGKRPRGCATSCYDKEAAGLPSFRAALNGKHLRRLRTLDLSDPRATTLRPVYWDLRPTNLCNFACVMCNPVLSSRHRGAELRVTNEDALLAQLAERIGDVEEVYFAGGEPLLMPWHERALDLLLAHGRTDVQLVYSSNVSVLEHRGRDILERWAAFPRVAVFASLDGVGALGEELRVGQDWARTEANMDRLAASGRVALRVAPCVQRANVAHLGELHRRCLDRGWIDLGGFTPHLLHAPIERSIAGLDAAAKDHAEARLREHVTWLQRLAAPMQVKLELTRTFTSIIGFMRGTAAR